MALTEIYPVYGSRAPCSNPLRLEQYHARVRALKLEKARKPDKPEDFVVYHGSDDEEDNTVVETQFLRTSRNCVDYVKGREMGSAKIKWTEKEYASRHILTHEMFKERPIWLNHMNKVFCSQWLSDRQVIFGTKCNKLMVYDVVKRHLDQIPSLKGSRNLANPQDQHCGIHAVQINPSRSLLATGALSSSDIAIYKLPTLDPVCVGQGAHLDWVFDMCWLDDEYLVSGSRDTRMALWKVQVDDDDEEEETEEGPSYEHMKPLVTKDCKSAQKVRAVAFNKAFQEIAALSLNGFIHIWNAKTFEQKLSRKLPSCQENVCLAVQDTGMYAVGCRSYTLLLDPRTLQAVKKISTRYSGCGIRSASFQENILTIGTGVGIIMFYDLRAGKYLESNINSSRTVVLKTSKGWVFPDDEYIDGFQNLKYTPAIYTHCYDESGTRLFTAGGPLPANLDGNYAGLWH